MSEFVLYATPGTCARVIMIAMEEAEIPFETRLVRIMRQEQRSPEYLAVNPWGTLPALELDDGNVITEAPCIMRYLEALHPEPNLLGRDPLEAARIEAWERFCEMNGCVRTAGFDPAGLSETINRWIVGSESFGQIAIGQRADMLALVGDPGNDLGAVQQRLGVVAQGRWYGDAWLQSEIEALAQRYAGQEVEAGNEFDQPLIHGGSSDPCLSLSVQDQ